MWFVHFVFAVTDYYLLVKDIRACEKYWNFPFKRLIFDIEQGSTNKIVIWLKYFL